jgi:two-component sensor histidine kinase
MPLIDIEGFRAALRERSPDLKCLDGGKVTKSDPSHHLDQAANGNDWHRNTLAWTAKCVASGWSDEKILGEARYLTQPGYTVDETIAELTRMIAGARAKGFDVGAYSGSASSADVARLSHCYHVSDNQFILVEQGRRKPVEVVLSNFVAQIETEITHDDGVSQHKVIQLSGWLHSGGKLPVIKVQSKDFDRVDWILEHWGSEPQIYVRPRSKEHWIAAVKQCSKPERNTVFQHTGWRRVDNCYVYLTAGGAIGKDGFNHNVATDLPGNLTDYDLPEPRDAADIDLLGICDLLVELIDEGAGLLMLGCVFRSVFAEFKPCTVSLFLVGTTGTRKSAVLGVLMAFFGARFNGFHLPENWSSTANSLEKKASIVKDAIIGVDDFVLTGSISDVNRANSKAERFCRAQGNQAGRGRLTSNTDLRDPYVPRGMIAATGEDLPRGRSLQARLLVQRVDRGGINLDALTELQRLGADGKLVQLMANFIQWSAKKADDGVLKTMLQDVEEGYKRDLIVEGHARSKDNLAQVMTGFGMLMRYAQDAELLSEDSIKYLEQQIKAAALVQNALHSEADLNASDAVRFVKNLRSALSMGLCHLAHRNGTHPENCTSLGWREKGSGEQYRIEPQGPKIGWVEHGLTYLDMIAALRIAKQVSNSTGDYLGSSEGAIKKALGEAGMIADAEKDRFEKKVTIEGVRRRVLCLKPGFLVDSAKNNGQDDLPIHEE